MAGEPTAVLEALARALGEMTNPGTSATADMGTFTVRYTTLAALLDHVRPVLNRHGLAVVQWVSGTDGQVTVRTDFVHAAGIVEGAGLALASGRGPQAAGSAISYARRYSLAAACGIASDLDDDGATAQRAVNEAPLASQAQVTALGRRMRDLGITDREERLVWVNARLDRTVASSKELTTQEAGMLLDELKGVDDAR